MELTSVQKNLHLIISIGIVIPIGLIYGLQPDLLFNVKINSTDEANILKAIMGLYLAFAVFWLYAIYDNQFWVVATISNILFMLGLGLGRVVSSFVDGTPSPIFMFGTLGELILGFYGIYILSKNKNPIV